MIRFIDGPAAGKTMTLRRAPTFLRVTHKIFKLETQPVLHQKEDLFDALDAPEDTPTADEELFAYINTGESNGTYHVRYGGKDKHKSGFYLMAEYRLYSFQPPDEIMRDNAKWVAWCESKRTA